MISFSHLISWELLCCLWLVWISPLQAMEAPDDPEVHILLERLGSDCFVKSEICIEVALKLKYTFCSKPSQSARSSFQGNSQTNKLPKVSYEQEEELAIGSTEEEDPDYSSASDTRYQVKNPSLWPHCVHGHLLMRFKTSANVSVISVGSGVLVGPNHVLTAGHNLFDHKRRAKWANEVWFSPGRKGESFPLGCHKASLLLCSQEWIKEKKDNYDFGMVILDHAVGQESGWLGLLCAPDAYLQNHQIVVTGYPGDKGSNDYYSAQMWEKESRLKKGEIGDETIAYTIPTSDGQSGGAIWSEFNINNIQGLNFYSIGVHTDASKGIRLTENKFNRIINWIRSYHLKEPISLTLWNKGNSYYQQGKYEEAFDCFHNAYKEVEKTNYIPDHVLLKLADCYWKGRGTDKNYIEALKLYAQVKNSEDCAKILFRRGRYFLEGLGGDKDVLKGLQALEEAVKKNSIDAIRRLYRFYVSEGETQDLAKAEKYRQLAQTFGKPISSPPSFLDSHSHVRHWGGKVKGNFLHNLPEAPSVEGLIDSYPEGSNKSYLTLLWERLHKDNNVTISATRKTAISGMGGIGKTSLAARYAHEALVCQAYKLIYWISSETENKLKEGYRNLLELLDVRVEDTASLSKLLMLLTNNKFPKPWLLIYDNVPDSRFLDKKVPVNGHILITSRCQEGWEHDTLSLDVFSLENAVEYLFKRIDTRLHKIERNKDTEKVAEQIAEELGRLPLALSHAAGYIAEQEILFDDYLIELRRKFDFIFNISDLDKNDHDRLSHDRLIAKTWPMAENKISPLAKELIQYF